MQTVLAACEDKKLSQTLENIINLISSSTHEEHNEEVTTPDVADGQSLNKEASPKDKKKKKTLLLDHNPDNKDTFEATVEGIKKEQKNSSPDPHPENQATLEATFGDRKKKRTSLPALHPEDEATLGATVGGNKRKKTSLPDPYPEKEGLSKKKKTGSRIEEVRRILKKQTKDLSEKEKAKKSTLKRIPP